MRKESLLQPTLHTTILQTVKTPPKAALPMNLYFYLDEHNQQHGPISLEQFSSYGIKPSTLVWCKGMEDWKPVSLVEELREWANQQKESTSSSSHEAQQDVEGNASQPDFQSNASYNQTNMSYVPCPPTHLLWAILSTACCCLPLGIVAIVKSSQVSTYYSRGNYDAALIASDDARRWCIYALVVGLLLPLIRILLGLIFGFAWWLNPVNWFTVWY